MNEFNEGHVLFEAMLIAQPDTMATENTMISSIKSSRIVVVNKRKGH